MVCLHFRGGFELLCGSDQNILVGWGCLKPCLHRDSDPDPDPDWLRLHGGKLDLNPDSAHACGLWSRFESGFGTWCSCNTPLISGGSIPTHLRPFSAHLEHRMGVCFYDSHTNYRRFHNPCNADYINFHIWKLILVQCECDLRQIWSHFNCCKDYANSCNRCNSLLLIFYVRPF